MLGSYVDKLRRLARDPAAYAWVPGWLLARARGELYRHGYRLATLGRVRIGRGFAAECSVRIRGPGRVTIGDGCSALRSNLQEVAIVTLGPHAVVEIGDGSQLGGLRVRCAERVKIGPRALTALSTVTDADRGEEYSLGRPVEIGENCWLGVDTAVLAGVRLGKDVVVSGGSVVTRDMPDGVVAMGNPARPVRVGVSRPDRSDDGARGGTV